MPRSLARPPGICLENRPNGCGVCCRAVFEGRSGQAAQRGRTPFARRSKGTTDFGTASRYTDTVAVVGAGCRCPGGGSGADGPWGLLRTPPMSSPRCRRTAETSTSSGPASWSMAPLRASGAAERLIRHARARGTAVDVHRPGSRTPNRPSRPQADLRRSTTRQWCDPVRALCSRTGGGVRDARQTTAVQRGRPHRDQLAVERRPQPRSGCPPGTGPLAGEGVPPERLPVPGHRAAVRGRGTGPGASGSSTPLGRWWATAIVRPRIRPG